jgi:phosphoribosylamine--glycine ligase
MNILLLGSGGREHALAWKISQSPQCTQLFIAPGNAGTAQCGINIQAGVNDFEAIKKAATDHTIDMVVVGPEDPLVKGVYEFFKNDPALKDIPVIGPSKTGAQLEGSKDFSKEFMQRHNIPTARFRTFSNATLSEGLKFLETLQPPYVLKADGLAAGKGVLIPQTLADAKKELTEMLSGKFGTASSRVVIEEFLHGIELSVFVLTDGNTYKILPEAKDYKRIGDGDTGLNTGGMGAVSPVPFADKVFLKKVKERIVTPTIEGLKKEKIDYKGFIFIGLMATPGKDAGAPDPFVIEYNVRMGDPETEVVIPRIQNDIVEVFMAVAKGKLSEVELRTDPRTMVTVMLVSGGYPGDYAKGKIISGLDGLKDKLIFHAGTSSQGNTTVSSGGRVLAVTAAGNSIAEAAARSYDTIAHISFDGMAYRKDIGKDLLLYEKQPG